MTTHTHLTAAIPLSNRLFGKRTSMTAPNVRHLAMAAGFGVAALTFSLWAQAEGKEKVDLPQYAGDIKFDRVMGPALLEDQLRVEDEESRPVSGIMRGVGGGREVRFKPSRPLNKGNYRIEISPILEDVAGNRMNETLDHAVSEKSGDPSGLELRFVAP